MSTRLTLWTALVCLPLVGSIVGCATGDVASPEELAAQADQLFTLDLRSGESWIGATDAQRSSQSDCQISVLGMPEGGLLTDNLFQWKPTADQVGVHELDLAFEGACDGLEAADTYLLDVTSSQPTVAASDPARGASTLPVHDLE